MFRFTFFPVFLCVTILFPVSVFGASDIAQQFENTQTRFSSDTSRLTALVNELLNNNPALQAKEARVDASYAQYQADSRPLYNPELDIDYENTDVDTSSIGISQAIDWSDKRGGRKKLAQLKQQQTLAELSLARQSLAAELLHNISRYHTAKDKNTLIQLRIELLQEFVSITRKRFLSGDVNQAELSLARLAFADASMQRSRIASELMSNRQSLITLMGKSLEQWPGLPAVLPEVDLKDKNLQDLINHHPLMLVQSAKIKSAMARVQLRRLERNADPVIGIRAGKDSDSDLLGFNLSIPLHIRNNFKAEVNVANAQLIESEFESKNLLRQLKSQLLSTASRYQLVRKTWMEWQKVGQNSMSAQFSLIRKQWQSSEISSTDYFLQLNQTLETRLSAIELRQEFWTAWIDWLNSSTGIKHWLNLNHPNNKKNTEN